MINKPPPLSHRFLTFSHPSFSFPLPASDFFSFLEKPPPYEAVYDIFSKMYVFNFVVSFYADAILYPGVLSGRCIISQYQLWHLKFGLYTTNSTELVLFIITSWRLVLHCTALHVVCLQLKSRRRHKLAVNVEWSINSLLCSKLLASLTSEERLTYLIDRLWNL